MLDSLGDVFKRVSLTPRGKVSIATSEDSFPGLFSQFWTNSSAAATATVQALNTYGEASGGELTHSNTFVLKYVRKLCNMNRANYLKFTMHLLSLASKVTRPVYFYILRAS